MDYRTLVEHAVTKGWEKGAKVGIIFQVTHGGEYIDGLLFPHGMDKLKTIDGERAVIINLSLSVCKQFNYVGEYKQFVYDVSVGGKPFFGNIPPVMVVDVIDMNTMESFYDPENPVIEDVTEAMVETPSHNFVKLKIVTNNPHITSKQPAAKLKVVH